MLVLSAAPRADLDAGPRASALLSVTPRDRTMLPVDPLRAPRPRLIALSQARLNVVSSPC